MQSHNYRQRQKSNCKHCHNHALYRRPGISNVGLEGNDESKVGRRIDKCESPEFRKRNTKAKLFTEIRKRNRSWIWTDFKLVMFARNCFEE